MLETIELELLRWWHNRQKIKDEENEINISSLLQRIKDWVYKTKKLKYNIECFNLETDSFDCLDLFDFLLHYKLVENAELKYPIIINNKWQVIDWRHRICKAILQWKKEIEAIQILDNSVI